MPFLAPAGIVLETLDYRLQSATDGELLVAKGYKFGCGWIGNNTTSKITVRAVLETTAGKIISEQGMVANRRIDTIPVRPAAR